MRQNGHYYKLENHLETKILEVDSKKSHKDGLECRTDGMQVSTWEPVS